VVLAREQEEGRRGVAPEGESSMVMPGVGIITMMGFAGIVTLEPCVLTTCSPHIAQHRMDRGFA
jgi:hypothetical protein